MDFNAYEQDTATQHDGMRSLSIDEVEAVSGGKNWVQTVATRIWRALINNDPLELFRK